MPLRHIKPTPPLLAELEEVSRHAAAFRQAVQTANILPNTFPIDEIQRIAVTLEGLPAGTAEGCRIPLDYARVRLAEIGQQQIKIEEETDEAAENFPPALARGMVIDQALGKLLSAITYAQAEYFRQAGEVIDEEEPAPGIQPTDTIAAEIGVLVKASESVEEELEAFDARINEAMVPGSARADQLRRQGRDAEGHVRLAGNELQQQEPRPSRLEKIILVLKRLPSLIETTGQALKVGMDIAEPFADQWFNQIPTDIYRLVVKHLRNFASNLEKAGRRLSEKAPQGETALSTLTEELRIALERQQLTLVYQPQFDLKASRIVGVEALVRWNHPERGLLRPDQFLSAADESGQIYEIGLWVLNTACRQYRSWQNSGLPKFRLAINVSSMQLQKGRFEEDSIRVFQAFEMDPSCLEFELNENAFLLDLEGTDELLRRFRSMGITVAMDDFGTGYSSLSLLQHFQPERIKIDPSFIRALYKERHAEAVVTAVIQLAHGLKIDVIAEGVETKEQLDFLRGCGCDEGQGYLFSEPLSGSEVSDKLLFD